MSAVPDAMGALAWIVERFRRLGAWLLDDYTSELSYAAVAVLWTIVRAMGKTVESGQTGLKFSFGRAVRVVEPGFHPLIPFLQVIRTIPTRSRTLELSSQRVVTDEGLVFEVDANLVYRVVDLRRALIEIDDLVGGMQQMLALSVQELLRPRRRAQLYASAELDLELSQRMAARLEPWGVAVEHAGFPSLRPSPETLRITQLGRLGGERAAALARMGAAGVEGALALALTSEARLPVARTRALVERARAQRLLRRRARLVQQAVEDAGLRIAARRAQENVFARHARIARERRRIERERWG